MDGDRSMMRTTSTAVDGAAPHAPWHAAEVNVWPWGTAPWSCQTSVPGPSPTVPPPVGQAGSVAPDVPAMVAR